jgi:hypothetical protein
MYHIGRRPASPKPAERWGEKGGWTRSWMKGPVPSGVFMTPDPTNVVMHHGVSGNVYTYKVPEWVIEKAGGIHRFDSAGELLISQEMWEEAGDEIEFLGKKMGQQELWDSVDPSIYRSRSGPPSEHKKSGEVSISSLARTKHPEQAIKMMTDQEREKALNQLAAKYEVKPDEIRMWPGDRKGLRIPFFQMRPDKKDQQLLDLLNKHVKESVFRRYIGYLLAEEAITISREGPSTELRARFDAFLAEYDSMSKSNPLNPSLNYWYMGKKDDADCLVLTDLSEWDGAIHVGSIQTVPPDVCEGQGFASQIMNKLVNLADKHEVPMSLDPAPFGSEKLGVKELMHWYRRAGFSPNDDRGGEWWRDPK